MKWQIVHILLYLCVYMYVGESEKEFVSMHVHTSVGNVALCSTIKIWQENGKEYTVDSG